MHCPFLTLLQWDDSGLGIFIILIFIIITAVVLIGWWRLFEKGGKPGWGCLIPIYNLILLLEIVGRPVWWILLYLIPLVNLIIWIIVSIDLARKFGKGTGFALGLAFLGVIFIPILGFGDAQYQSKA